MLFYYKLSLPEELRYVKYDERNDYLGQLSKIKCDEQDFNCISEREFIEEIKNLSRACHNSKLKAKRKLVELDNIGVWWVVNDRDEYKTKQYRGKRSSYYKGVSNKRTRKILNLPNGKHYKKILDFWNEIYG